MNNANFDADIVELELDNIANIDMEQFGFDIVEKEFDDIPEEINYVEKVSVVIDCKDDNEAEEIFNKLTNEGYECHISTL